MSHLHTLKLENQNLHASFSSSYDPILTVQSGDTIVVTTPDIAFGFAEEKGMERVQFHSREKETAWGHPMIGPIKVEEARQGMTLEITLHDIETGWYGWNCAGGKTNWQNEVLGISKMDEVRLDWHLDAERMIGTTNVGEQPISVVLKPFMGLLGVAPSEPGIHSTIPPRRVGGNIDCKELVSGSTLYLPIEVDGALFSIGDGHAIQGDGEVSGQAIECPMNAVTFTLKVREDVLIKSPRANTPSGWLTFGFHEDLNEATALALQGMIELIQEQYKVSKTEATALASVVVDLRITQVVNQVKGVHALLPHGAIR
ncbi:acetamidase/formamidase family protein [Bacillus sp. RD4P76]|uniref:Acetamidase/formamidase family protein n=1 Tax=Bacillus suaedaesalsae TaxID=2810349 RepID=A0ABS2DEG9_9BACI|nr:acetamidase/formamidase family protein [Bacillus suaedaesalsae]MBM6616866.1 acetamidase/formamidase family protein [Bacillus suaedaesalsae]